MSTDDSDHRPNRLVDVESRIDSARLDIEMRIERLRVDISASSGLGKSHATLTVLQAILDDKERFSVPPAGKFILACVCPPEKLEALLGDLQELCEKWAKTRGVRTARVMYWWHVARTTSVYLIGALMQVLKLVAALRKIL
jgi:hypothetical protein